MALTATPGAIARYAAGILLCLAPLFIVFLSPARGDATLVYVGVLPTFVSLISGSLVALGVAFATSAVVFVGLLVSPHAALAAGLMAVLGLVVAWSFRHGWEVPATYVATQAALAAIAAPHVTMLQDHPANTVPAAAAAAGFVLFGGLWVAITGHFLLGDLAQPHPPLTTHLVTFGVVLALLLAIETYAAIAWIPGTNVWWVVLTTLVVLSPDQKHSMSRSVERAGGTVLGAIVATAVISLLGRGTTLTLVGVVAALLTAMAYVTARYWIFAALLTFALVVLTVPADRVVHSSADRIGYTLIAAAVALVVSAALKRLIVRYPHLP